MLRPVLLLLLLGLTSLAGCGPSAPASAAPQVSILTQDVLQPTATNFGTPQEYIVEATIYNAGGAGEVTVLAALYVLRQPNEALKYANQYDARRERFAAGETKTVRFSFTALKGLPFSGNVWCTSSLADYYRYARTPPVA